MKTFAFIILFSVSVAQILLGLLVGRLRIYALVSPFWGALQLEGKHSKAFSHYISMFQDQWSIVAWTGVCTLMATAVLIFLHRKKSELNKPKPRA